MEFAWLVNLCWIYSDKVQYCPGEVCGAKSKQDIQKTSGAQWLVVLGFIAYIILVVFYLTIGLVRNPMTSSESLGLQNLNEIYMKEEISSELIFRYSKKISLAIGNFLNLLLEKRNHLCGLDRERQGLPANEEYILKQIMPFVANTHTETTVTGTKMTKAYEEAK